jgi:hypothetical protein
MAGKSAHLSIPWQYCILAFIRLHNLGAQDYIDRGTPTFPEKYIQIQNHP